MTGISLYKDLVLMFAAKPLWYALNRYNYDEKKIFFTNVNIYITVVLE